MQEKKETLLTSEKSKKGKVFVLQSEDIKNKGIIDKIDLEIDFLKQKETINNPFPIEIFPKSIQEIIIEANDKYQFSIDYLGAGILSAAATAIGNTHKIIFKENWIEQCNLYMVIVGRPGDSKSHALNFCYKPINSYEDILYKEYEDSLKEYEDNYNSEDKSKTKKPILKKYLISDFTPEALILNHYNNPRGLCIYVDELSGWLNNFNRYNNSGEAQTYLSIWSGNTFSSDRASGKSIRIKNPYINVIGSTQTSVLKDFSKNGRSSNGFMDRLLFVYPENPKTLKWNIKKVNRQIIKNFDTIFDILIQLKTDENNEPFFISLEKLAEKHLFKWQNNRPEKYLFEYERSIDVKLQQYTIRFSLILELLFYAAENKPKKQISIDSIKSSIKLFNYFYKNALKVRSETTQKNYYETLTELQKKILSELPKEFTTARGIKIACKNKRISDRQFKTYLNDKKLFKRVSRGNYIKIL